MAGRKGGKVQRDTAVTSGLDDLIEETASSDPEFGAAVADAEARRSLLRQYGRARQRKKLNQTEVARQMGTTQSAISEMEQGIVEPRLSTLQRYARILGYRLRFMLVEEPASSYRDRVLHYPVVPLRSTHIRRSPEGGARPLEDLVDVVTLGNVSFVQFERRDNSQLGGSLAKRLKISASA